MEPTNQGFSDPSTNYRRRFQRFNVSDWKQIDIFFFIQQIYFVFRQRRAHRSEASAIETLINNGKFKEAVDMAESLLKKGVHPYHRVLRYMMQQLSAAGEIELIKTIGKHLSVVRDIRLNGVTY